jgi:predicted enzyme related to lactoylglutathione lyase
MAPPWIPHGTVRMTPALLVNIDVDDLERAVAFYGRAFGLRVGRRFGSDAVEMLGAAAPIHLLARAPGSPAAVGTPHSRDYGRHWTPVHLDFVVDALEPALARAVSAGARVETPITGHPWGRIAMLADPFGHGFCLIQFLGRGYDEIAGE